MAIGTLVGAQVQDTTTTTGTGAITLSNTVAATAPANTTTFASQFAPTGVYPVGNIFYAISDGSNIEIGLGTLTSATNLTRDYILGSYTGGSISLATANVNATHVNFAAGTKQVYSNTTLFGTSVAYWSRIPDDNAANIFNATMSGTFTATINAGSATATGTVRYKISNEGIVTLQIPAISATANGTTLTMTGIPAILSNMTTEVVPCLVTGTSTGGVTVPGLVSIAGGATPTSTGTATFSQYTSLTTGYTATFTTAVVNGVPSQIISYPAF